MKRWALLLAAAAVAGAQPKPPSPAPKAEPAVQRRPINPLDVLTARTGVKFGPLGAFRLPALESYTLENGLRVRLLEDHSSDAVWAELMVAAGSDRDPADQPGLADMTARAVLRGGAATVGPDELSTAWERLGASVVLEVTPDLARFKLASLSQTAPESLRLFSTLLREPAFADEEVDLLRGGLRQAIAVQHSVAPAVAEREFLRAVLGDQAGYGRRQSYDHADNITRESLAGFHRRWYAPGRAVLVVSGSFPTPAMKQRIAEAWGGWRGAAEQAAERGAGNAPGGPASRALAARPGLILADRNEWSQAHFVVGHGGPLVSPEDQAALAVAAVLLTGPGSEVAQTLDQRRFWEAAVEASWDQGRGWPPLFRIRGAAQSAFAGSAVQLVLDQIDKLLKTPPEAARVEAAKSQAIFRLALTLNGADRIAGEMVLAEFTGSGSNRLSLFEQALRKVRPADVARVVREHVKPEQLVVSLAAAAGRLDRPAEKIRTPVERAELKVDPPSAWPACPEGPLRAEGLARLERMRGALGGLERLLAVKDYRGTGKAVLWSGRRPIELSGYREYWVAEGTIRQEQDWPSGAVVFFYNGEIAWLARGGLIGTLPPAMLEQARVHLARFPVMLALGDRRQGSTVCAVGEHGIQITRPELSIRVQLDAATSLPSRVLYRIPDGSGSLVSVEESFFDWMETGGVRLPARLVEKRDGQRVSEVRFGEVAVNVGLDKKEVERRP